MLFASELTVVLYESKRNNIYGEKASSRRSGKKKNSILP